jgi:two-component system, cell cycle sensor histidine kinase and response regulator CckA
LLSEPKHPSRKIAKAKTKPNKRKQRFSKNLSSAKQEAEALKKSEEKYRALIENSLQGISIIQDDRFVFCNNAFAAMTGYSVEELFSLGDAIVLLHPDDQILARRRHDDRIAGRPVPTQNEHRIIKKDGKVRWNEIRASLVDFNGRPAVQHVSVDITERREADIALRESEERFRQIAETIEEIFWIYDVESRVTTYLSPAFERIWGYPRDCVVNNPEPFMDPVHPDDRAYVTVMAEPFQKGQPVSFEYRIIRPDGTIRYIWNRGFPITDENGQVKRYVGVGQDVTAWRQAEEDLRESREYLTQIINRISDPIFVKNDEHKYVLVNDALCEFEQKPREQLLGRGSFDDLPEALAAYLLEREAEVFRTGKEGLSEDTITDRKGKPHTLLAKKSLLVDKKGNRQIVGVLRDITDHKRLEAQFMQAHKMEAIGALAGGVAHDFNNLLNVINGYAEVLLEEFAENDPKRRDLEQIKNAGQRAASLTTQLLAFSRRQILKPEILDLNTIITNIGSMLRRLIGENIEFLSNLQSDLGLVRADPGKIEQAIINLAINARDAMPQGGRLILETANVDLDDNFVQEDSVAGPGRYVMLSVCDNGTGMDARTQERIFEPFFTTKEKGKGTGLGLPTVYGTVKQSNGFIWVYSEPGKGTTFKIYFPRAEGHITKMPAEKSIEPGLRGSETILVVEDEELVRTLACRVLRDRGYTILEASDGAEALDKAQSYDDAIDMVFTDVVMPGMSGSELVSRLKDVRPNIKALYASGYTDSAIVHNGSLDFEVAFLQKPFTVESLARKVREVLTS